MKLSTYAKEKGISYKTAWRWWQAGYINGEQLPNKTIIVYPEKEQPQKRKTVIYCRVSSSENKKNLETQAERLVDFTAKKRIYN